MSARGGLTDVPVRFARLYSPPKPGTRAMKTRQGAADALVRADQADARARTEDARGEGSYADLSAGGAGAGRGNDTLGERAPVCDDDYWSGPSPWEEEDEEKEEEGVTLLLCVSSIPRAADDEAYYITTHEILLAELSDHESSCAAWDAEEGSPRESPPRGSARSSPSKPPEVPGGGQTQLSIRGACRAINGPGSSNTPHRATRSEGAPRDPPPRSAAEQDRVHAGRKDAPGRSSGTSSAVSEVDDTDREVRTLTAKTFRSLAHPGLDAVRFGASSESSASERGVGCPAVAHTKLDGTLATLQNSASTARSGKKVCALSPGALTPAPPGRAELMGTVSRGTGGVVTLTETLDFRCGVARSEEEKRTTRAQSAAGSRFAEDVPDVARRAGQPASKPKEEASKKAIFASSLIKNVISKKMQFEQERKMERGEISERRQAPSPNAAQQVGDSRRRSSKASESSSDCTLTNAEDSGDAADAAPALAPERSPSGAETRSEPGYRAGADTAQGPADAFNRTLLRSHNSAFRRWRDDDDKEHDRDPSPQRTSEGRGGATKPTKMSHLFVPSIQPLPRLGSDGALSVANSRAEVKSRSPEIKINLRSARNPVAASDLQTTRSKDLRRPPLAASLKGESAVPHFTVRDFRDGKTKLQTPIHQVRDVRKLVKSSYHFLSLQDGRSRLAQRPPPGSGSPIVIKCQSVNTNRGEKQPQGHPGKAESGRVAPKRQEKSPEPEQKSEWAGQAALEKLQAAVRTMEQLYVFEKNEWKRKTEAPPPLTANGSGCMTGSRAPAPVSLESVAASAVKSMKLPKASAGEVVHTKEPEKPNEDYLTIPLRSQVSGEQQVAQEAAMPPEEPPRQVSAANAAAAEAWLPDPPLAGIFPPQLFCLSPAVAPVPALEPFPALQRKLLLDPSTGSCYLLEPPTRRLFDPETGQYVDVALPPPPTTPAPMSVSPVALSSAAYGHAYLIYPGLAPPPAVIAAQLCEGARKSPYMEVPFYAGKCARPPSGAEQQASPGLPLQPIISISSPQGPRIVAPPSFDGATMSFVVEHR